MKVGLLPAVTEPPGEFTYITISCQQYSNPCLVTLSIKCLAHSICLRISSETETISRENRLDRYTNILKLPTCGINNYLTLQNEWISILDTIKDLNFLNIVELGQLFLRL